MLTVLGRASKSLIKVQISYEFVHEICADSLVYHHIENSSPNSQRIQLIYEKNQDGIPKNHTLHNSRLLTERR